MKKRRSYLINHKIIMIATVLCSMFFGLTVSADEEHGPWKGVTMAPGIEYTVACRDTNLAKICYWWFRNTTDTKITLMYLMRGDGLSSANQTTWVKNGFLTRKTEITLAPRHTQPIVEGYAGQFAPATQISDVRALTFSMDDGSVPAVKDRVLVGASQVAAKQDQLLCRANTQVVLGTCKCASGYRASDDANKNRRICLKTNVNNETQSDQHESRDNRQMKGSPSQSPPVEMDPARGICGH